MLVCRVCLSEDISIIISDQIRMMMRQVLGISIIQNDGLPNKLCQKCNRVISSAYKLKLLAKKSYSILMNSLKPNEEEKPLEIKIENFKENDSIKIEVSDEDDHGNSFDYMSHNKIESENIMTEWKFDAFNELDVKNEDGTDEKSVNVIKDLPVATVFDIPLKMSKSERKMHKKTKRHKAFRADVSNSSSICDLCGAKVKNLDIHRRRHMSNEKNFKCEQCPKAFDTNSGLKKHVKIVHLGLLEFCELCQKYYKKIKQHKQLVHGNMPRNIPCLLCDLKFRMPAELKYHMKTHTQEKPFPCPVCLKPFRTNFLCESHRRRVHEKERSKICQYCSKAFFSENQLEIHLTTHTKEKNYECNECGKRFSLKAHLKIHILRHIGTKNCKCTLCDKRFITGGALSTHMKSHTKEKNHECKYCNVKFSRSDHRNRHEKTAHENKRFC